MRQSIFRAIFIVMFFLLFKYLIKGDGHPILKAFVSLYVLEGAFYWLLFKINLDENVGQPK